MVSREGMSLRPSPYPATPATPATPANVEPGGAVVPQALRFRGPTSKDKPKDKPKAKSAPAPAPAPAAAPPRVPYAYADEEAQLKVGFATAADAEDPHPKSWEAGLLSPVNVTDLIRHG